MLAAALPLDTSFLQQALAGVLPPAAVTAAVLWLGVRARRSDPEGRRGAWAMPLAIGLGYAAGHLGTHGAPRLNPWPRLVFGLPVKDALFYLALLGALVGAYEALRSARGRGRPWHLRLLLAIAAPLYLFDFMRRHHWNALESTLWTAGLAAGLLALWSALDGLARRRPGAATPLAWCGASAGAAVALHLAGSASLGQLAGALATTLGVAAALALTGRAPGMAPGGTLVIALLYGALVGCGRFAADLSATAALLLIAAPLCAWVGELPVLARRGPGVRGAGVVLAALAPALAAAAIEHHARPADPYASVYGTPPK